MILETKTKKVAQGSCHLLSIAKSLKGTDYVWHTLCGVWHTGYQQHVKCECLNDVAPHWVSQTTTVPAVSPRRQPTEPPRGIGSLGRLSVRKGKRSPWTPQLSSTK